MSAPAPIVWLNDGLVPIEDARIGIFDRGFLFGDGVYELVRFFAGVGVGMDLHVARLRASLAEARINGFNADQLMTICDELLRENALDDACVYLQVTRGDARTRSHLPPSDLRPTVMAFATAAPPLSALRAPERVRAILLPDERWLRCHIKTISLMGNVLAAQSAADRGADEAILHRDGVVSEGGSTNVFIARNGRLATPAAIGAPAILHGVSRAQIIVAAKNEGIPIEERRVTVEELRSADEIMITSSRRLVSSVIELDGHPVGSGSSTVLAPRLFELLRPRLHSAL